jgi:hypothetical protein
MRRTILLTMAAALCAIIGGAGCGKKEPKGRPLLPTTTQPASVPKPPPVPGVDENGTGTDELLVNPVPRDRSKDRYTWEDQAPQGALRVICRIPKSSGVALPPNKPIDFKGKTAIKDPATVKPYRAIYNGISSKGYDIKNELEYYQKWNPPLADTASRWLNRPERGGGDLAVNGVAIIVEGIKTGSREELQRGSALVNHRYGRRNYIMGQGNYSGYNIIFVPANEKVIYRSGDHFPCEVSVHSLPTGTPFGQPFIAKALPFKREGMYAGWMLRANPGSATQPRAIPAPSPTFRAQGAYRMSCSRHPWHVGYAVVVDNPYVAVSGAQKSGWPSADGKVSIAGIPPGTWTVRLWHPRIKPVEEVHEIKITRDETTHLVVDFQLPDQLK